MEGWGLPCEGVVAKNFVLSLESLSSLGFEERNLGCRANFAGMSRSPGGVQKVCAKKVRAHFSFPKHQMPPERCVRRSWIRGKLSMAAAMAGLSRASSLEEFIGKRSHTLRMGGGGGCRKESLP